jgi:hypothetical protein
MMTGQSGSAVYSLRLTMACSTCIARLLNTTIASLVFVLFWSIFSLSSCPLSLPSSVSSSASWPLPDFTPFFLPLALVRHSPGRRQRWHGCYKLGLRMVWFIVKLRLSTIGPRKAVLALAIKGIRSNKANTSESCWRIGYTPPSGQLTRYSSRPGRILLSCKSDGV